MAAVGLAECYHCYGQGQLCFWGGIYVVGCEVLTYRVGTGNIGNSRTVKSPSRVHELRDCRQALYLVSLAFPSPTMGVID